MTCAACSASVERSLNKRKGVEHAVVSLATNEAVVTFDPNLVDESGLIDAIESVGYGVRLERVELVVIGMTCASCATNVENALKKVDGVISATVNLATRKATVEFNPGLTNVPLLEKAIKNVGYDVEKSIEEDALTQRRRLEREERIHYRNRLIVGAIFTTPLVIFMFIDFGIENFMMWDSVRYSSLVLASIVYFYVGWPFFKSAYRNPPMFSAIHLAEWSPYW